MDNSWIKSGVRFIFIKKEGPWSFLYSKHGLISMVNMFELTLQFDSGESYSIVPSAYSYILPEGGIKII